MTVAPDLSAVGVKPTRPRKRLKETAMNKPVSSPVAQSAVNVRDLVSPRGLRFWLVEDYAVPIVSLEFAFRGGAAQDPPARPARLR